MIDHIEWNRARHFGELPSPFVRGKGERPLRITLHSDSLANLSGKEKDAAKVLKELSYLPEVEAVETKSGERPYLSIGLPDPKENAIPIQIVTEGQVSMLAAISNARQLPLIAASLIGQPDPKHQDATSMLNDLIIARAHCSVGRDILVTSAPLLLKHRNKRGLHEANPRTPLEAAQIVGLFLRSRDIYTYAAAPKSKYSFDRGLFYWVLVRYRLPSMWRYFSACVTAGKEKDNDLLGLGESILVRCVRALEARDAIGIQFYMPQNKTDSDQMMYHFDYLTLVIAGAIDAQARVANIAYQIGDDRWASFRGKTFVKALKSKGAQELHDLVNEQRFKDVTTLLYDLRNTIHAAALKIVTYQKEAGPRHSLIKVPANLNKSIWEATERLGSPELWGLSEKKPFGIFLEPYSYATTLLKEGFGVIDTIAAATNFKHLLPNIEPFPPVKDTGPVDSPFRQGERIALLA